MFLLLSSFCLYLKVNRHSSILVHEHLVWRTLRLPRPCTGSGCFGFARAPEVQPGTWLPLRPVQDPEAPPTAVSQHFRTGLAFWDGFR